MNGWTHSTGNLKRRIEIRQSVETASDSGSVGTVNTLVLETWAEFREMRGKEIFALGAENAQAEATFLIRWRNDLALNKRMVIVFGGKTWEITSIAEVGYKDRFEICAKIRRDN